MVSQIACPLCFRKNKLKMASDLFCTFNQYGHCKFGPKIPCERDLLSPLVLIHVQEEVPKTMQVLHLLLKVQVWRIFSFTYTRATDVEKELENLKHEINELKTKNLELRNMIVKIENQEITLKGSTEDKENPTQKEFKCDKCNYSASTNTVLKRHKTMKHKPNSVPQPIPKTPVNCVGQLDGCSASTSDYFRPESAICPSCDVKLKKL